MVGCGGADGGFSPLVGDGRVTDTDGASLVFSLFSCPLHQLQQLRAAAHVDNPVHHRFDLPGAQSVSCAEGCVPSPVDDAGGVTAPERFGRPVDFEDVRLPDPAVVGCAARSPPRVPFSRRRDGPRSAFVRHCVAFVTPVPQAWAWGGKPGTARPMIPASKLWGRRTARDGAMPPWSVFQAAFLTVVATAAVAAFRNALLVLIRRRIHRGENDRAGKHRVFHDKPPIGAAIRRHFEPLPVSWAFARFYVLSLWVSHRVHSVFCAAFICAPAPRPRAGGSGRAFG